MADIRPDQVLMHMQGGLSFIIITIVMADAVNSSRLSMDIPQSSIGISHLQYLHLDVNPPIPCSHASVLTYNVIY